jgi:hypothetical protein
VCVCAALSTAFACVRSCTPVLVIIRTQQRDTLVVTRCAKTHSENPQISSSRGAHSNTYLKRCHAETSATLACMAHDTYM